MAHGERCLLVHGHFYQPPRENPWTGQIDPQRSAAPWENWNRRIADECYIPMARSRLRDPDGRIEDMYNNYAHTSFNFGPTLLSWLEHIRSPLLRHLADAAVIDRTFAMAQAYNHMILPLADARDRHTQIVWGLKEFRHRFGFIPEGLWLAECGIDPETVRALVDHNVRFVILSPHQASRTRPFGRADWQDASMGAVDTRRSYRLFDTDGGGRTHFDRWLNVIFYTPGLNLKVSFDHILNRPDDLRRELADCYRDDSDEAQLVSVVTDGEIYGHHEKRGEEALSRLYRDIAPSLGLKVVSAGEFIRDHPPTREVKLWNGEDGRGSSWSCQHGVGRWFRDCGCRPPTPPGWDQSWRGPLRDAFDLLRSRARFVVRRELGPLVWDADDARDDYISVILKPAPETRRDFLARHAQRALTPEELGRLWSMLEASRNAMLMYTSCGWFFDEVSGLEPVQNMQYALRAAELIQPRHDEDLTALLEDALRRAGSNIPHFGDGAKVFRDLALPARRSNRELAAAAAVCLAADFPPDGTGWRILDRTETARYSDSEGNAFAWGSFVCVDDRLDMFVKTSWLARLDDLENVRVALHGYAEAQGDPGSPGGGCPFRPDDDFTWLRDIRRDGGGMARADFSSLPDVTVVELERLPEATRDMLYRRFAGDGEEALLDGAARFGRGAVPFVARARRHGAAAPETLAKAVAGAYEREMTGGVLEAVAGMNFGAAEAEAVEKTRGAAWDLGIGPSSDACRRAVFLTGMELLHWLANVTEQGWFESLKPQDTAAEGMWLAPQSQANHDARHRSAGPFAKALGHGLAGLREALAAEPDRGRGAVSLLPLPELLSFADRLGLEPKEMTRLAIEYWDFLDKPLARIVRRDAESALAGEIGDRLRRTGALLGFRPETVARRLQAARGEMEQAVP